jgi:diacylglycerol kinase (ATP)
MAADLRFLVNPSAGGGRAARALDRIRERARSVGASVAVSDSGEDFVGRATDAVESGARRLAVVGGDGTVHLALQAVATSSCELAVLPTGRGDDFATSLGVPSGMEAALELAISGDARGIDLAQIEGGGRPARWAGAYAGVGFDSAVTRTANGQPRWIPASLTYVLAVVRTLVDFSAPRVVVDHDGGRFEGRAMFATVCNAPRFGGGMQIAPEARMDDGLLDLVVVSQVPKTALLTIFPRVFSGAHTDHPAVSIVRTRSARITVDPEMLLGSDGELEGAVGSAPVEVSVAPRALRVVVPPGSHRKES